jgi:hypothetical protein
MIEICQDRYAFTFIFKVKNKLYLNIFNVIDSTNDYCRIVRFYKKAVHVGKEPPVRLK